MIESAAFLAPIGPPDTGASSIVMPCPARAAPIARVASGEIVLMSMKMLPLFMLASTPSRLTTSSTCGVLGNIEMAISASLTATATLSQRVAPFATTASAAADDISNTLSG